jgi:predicted ABC-type ATPase
MMPTLTVVAGANGSGKSTLTKQLERPILLIDPDAIAKELNPIDPASEAIVSGRQALALSQQYIQSESSFVAETSAKVIYVPELPSWIAKANLDI